MTEAILGFFLLYIVIKLYLSLAQMRFVKAEKQGSPILMNTETYHSSAEYAIEKERLGLFETLLEAGLFGFWVFYGLEMLQGIVGDGNGVGAIYFVIGFIITNFIIGLPLDLYKTFNLDKRYGFSNTTVGIYLKDLFKSALMLLLVGGAIIYAVSWIIGSFASWWIWAFAFLFTIVIGINALYTTVIAPMFNKFKPLEDSDLNAKIGALLSKVGFQSSGVFVMDASKRDARLNAYFGGLGKTKRVVLFDTLLEKLKVEELLAVLGHELGHFAHHDIIKNIVIMGAILFAAFFLYGNLPEDLFVLMGVSVDSGVIIALFMLLTPMLFFFLMPMVSFVSRANEYAADEFGSELGGKMNLVNALLKLITENKSFPKAHPHYIFFYYSHPPLVERLKALDYDVEQIPSRGES